MGRTKRQSLTQDELYETIGFNVRILRNLRGLTQEELAERVDVSRTQIANLEVGRSGMYVHTLVAFAKALDVNPESLLRRLDA